jgi:SAM-dependent methyltransferase
VNSIANADQHAPWNGDSGRRWAEDPDRRDEVLAPVAGALLAGAGIAAGAEVLDVGCGCGATTLAAARAAGPAGSAVGIDLSGPMLAVARRRARAGGRERAVRAGDAQVHAVRGLLRFRLRRFGTMFFADPVAAFANIARALRPGARLCLATWAPLAANDWLTIPGAVLLRYATPPEAASGPGMFAQSDPESLVATLAAAGLASVRSRPLTVALPVGASPAAAAVPAGERARPDPAGHDPRRTQRP